MKKIFLCIALSIIAMVANSQNAQRGFSFQGIARDVNGKALGSSTVDVQLSITQSGKAAYTEQQTVTTDAFGVFALVVGSVNPTSFATIDFSKVSYKLKVEVKVGGTYSLLNETELLSVPYAKAADNATKASKSDTAAYAANAFFPAGMVIPFAGPNIPDGWILCDGSAISRTTYPALYKAIGTAWGTGDGASTFNLPDMRGMFLRGVANGSVNDPDALARMAANGGNSGDKVGSQQADELKSHAHIYSKWYYPSSNGPEQNQNGAVEDRSRSDDATSNAFGGKETRPKNVNVNYIIKY
ncbi:MAG: tail fiber protein [Bacteroidetes bacterium]|nr:tail fiber protein [Bacteroidota bacterium]